MGFIILKLRAGINRHVRIRPPVVLFADAVPAVGMQMIPKTCAYVWTVRIGHNAMQQDFREAASCKQGNRVFSSQRAAHSLSVF